MIKGELPKKDQIKGKPTGRHKVFEHFPKDPKCAISKLTKTARARPPGSTRRPYSSSAENLVMRKTADRKGLNEKESRLQHRYAQSWYRVVF